MKSIVKSQLTGKWYQIAKGRNRCEKDFVEVMCYLSISCDDDIDVLYVGVKNGRSKKLRKMSLKILTNEDSNCLVVGNMFFRKKLKILTFDDVNDLIVLLDRRMNYFSILSHKPTVKYSDIENILCRIDFFKYNNNEIKFYSNSIV